MIRTDSRKAAQKTSRPAYKAPQIERVDISKTETGAINPTEFLAIIGPTS